MVLQRRGDREALTHAIADVDGDADLLGIVRLHEHVFVGPLDPRRHEARGDELGQGGVIDQEVVDPVTGLDGVDRLQVSLDPDQVGHQWTVTTGLSMRTPRASRRASARSSPVAAQRWYRATTSS